MREKYEDTFEAGMGAEAVQKLLAEIDLEVCPQSCMRNWKSYRPEARPPVEAPGVR